MLKRLIIFLVCLTAVAITGALLAPFFISVDTYKNQIIGRVEAATGRNLKIDGKLSVRFFPVAGITAENVTLSNPPGFPDKTPFISLSSMTLDVAVVPLLNKDIVIKNFIIKDAVINLLVNAGGNQSWAFTPQTSPDENEQKNPDTAAKSHRAKPQPKNFMLNNFELINASINYQKDPNTPPVELKKINTTIALKSSEASALIDGSFELNNKNIELKGGIGTLKTFFDEQKMELNLALKSELFNTTIRGNFDTGVFTGKEAFKTDSLKEVIAWVNPGKSISTPAKLAFQSESDLVLGTASCNLSNLHFVLDGLDAKGSIKVNYFKPKPAIDINLTADELDLNQFFPNTQHAWFIDNILPDAMAETSEHWSRDAIDISALNQLDAVIEVQANSIKIHKISAGKTLLKAKLQQGLLNADITSDNFYKGSGSVTATLNASQTPPTFDTRILLKSVDLASLLKDTIDNQNMSGVADIQANLKSTCQNEEAIISNLAGDGQIRVLNGEFKHISILDMVHNNLNAFGGTPSQNTVFTQLGGSFAIAQGVVTNHDLMMDTQGIKVGGDGSVNLPAYTVNYRLKPQLVTTTKEQAGSSTTKEGLEVPVLIEGSLDNPKFRPDLASTLQDALQDPKKFKEQLKNSKGVVKNLKGLLQGLGR